MTIGLFWTLFAGFALGLLMNAFLPLGLVTGGKALVLAAAIGIVGALAASFLGQGLHWWDREQLAAFIAAVVGAALLLGVARLALGNRAVSAPPAAGIR